MSNLELPDTVAKHPSIKDAYIEPENVVLDPSLLDKSLLERMPEPAGWRLLVLLYAGKGVTDGGIVLTQQTVERENLATMVGLTKTITNLQVSLGAKRAIGYWWDVMRALDSL